MTSKDAAIQMRAINDQNAASAKDWLMAQVDRFGDGGFSEMLDRVARDYRRIDEMPETFKASVIGLGVAKIYDTIMELRDEIEAI